MARNRFVTNETLTLGVGLARTQADFASSVLNVFKSTTLEYGFSLFNIPRCILNAILAYLLRRSILHQSQVRRYQFRVSS